MEMLTNAISYNSQKEKGKQRFFCAEQITRGSKSDDNTRYKMLIQDAIKIEISSVNNTRTIDAKVLRYGDDVVT